VRIAIGALAWLYAALLALPIYYLVVSSLKPNLEIFSTPFAFPTAPEFDNFVEAWERTQLGTALINSVWVTFASLALTLILSIPAAYGLSRSTGRLAVVVERLFSLGFLIPAFAALVPTLLLSITVGLFHTQTFVILFLPATALPLSVIVLTQFMRTVPPELEESAMIDGAPRMTILRHVYVPIAAPGIATVAILNFLSFWNEYLFVLILGGTETEVRTAQVAIPTLVSQNGTDFGVLAAATIVSVVPVFVVYAVLSRRMEAALLQGAVKA
jgi:multiple sugar transport system permease protein